MHLPNSCIAAETFDHWPCVSVHINQWYQRIWMNITDEKVSTFQYESVTCMTLFFLSQWFVTSHDSCVYVSTDKWVQIHYADWGHSDLTLTGSLEFYMCVWTTVFFFLCTFPLPFCEYLLLAIVIVVAAVSQYQ